MPSPASPASPDRFAAALIMVRPAAFGANPETAATNGFQAPRTSADADAGRREFDRAAARIVDAGIAVTIFEDVAPPIRPDAIFANNWLSTHADGRVVLYPMCAANRRTEVRREWIDALAGARVIAEVIDWSGEAERGRFLEGTGSLVIDPGGAQVFAAWSPRTDRSLAAAWAERFAVTLVGFDAVDLAGAPIYHTNVILTLGRGFSACGLARVLAADRPRVRALLEARGELVELSDPQILAFAGNMLQVVDDRGGPALILSTTALAALTPADRRRLERHTALVPLEIPTIEAAGGGSARCMLTEDFLARRPRVAS